MFHVAHTRYIQYNHKDYENEKVDCMVREKEKRDRGREREEKEEKTSYPTEEEIELCFELRVSNKRAITGFPSQASAET